jgi:outer membrane protein assembly factor BamB
MGWDGSKETVFCFDARTGRLLWKQSYPCADIVQWPGTRATPTISGDSVFTLGQHGSLRSWGVDDGKPRWTLQLDRRYEPDVDYGFAWSPLVTGDAVILSGGSRGLAVHRETGQFLWGNDGGRGACVSPVPFDLAGRHGVAVVTTAPDRNSVTLFGIEPRTGRELWRSPPWREKWGAVCVDLLVQDGRVFVSSAEQYIRGARFRIDDRTLVEEWSNTRLASYTGACVVIGDGLFGITKAGVLKCLDWNTGAEKWAQRGFGGHGSLMAASGQLLVQASDSGELVVVKASSEGYQESRRLRVFSGKPVTFTAPALADGRIYCRSYEGEVVCLNLAGR